MLVTKHERQTESYVASIIVNKPSVLDYYALLTVDGTGSLPLLHFTSLKLPHEMSRPATSQSEGQNLRRTEGVNLSAACDS